MQTIFLISLGAILGANLRYVVAQYVSKLIPSGFPFGTLIINVSASFFAGFFVVWTSERILADPRWRILIAIGFCATYSTYSSYIFETFTLMEKGQFLPAALNLFVTNLMCFVAVALGVGLARKL
ncbi:MAG TPA: fluoride efflux transporter CrcB [Bryobacteraceae bacterium]